MAKYRKKPVVIDAFRLDGNLFTREYPAWWVEAQDRTATMVVPVSGKTLYAMIKTLEGDMRADYGDWIIRGVNGELYPIKDEIFRKTYEVVDAETSD